MLFRVKFYQQTTTANASSLAHTIAFIVLTSMLFLEIWGLLIMIFAPFLPNGQAYQCQASPSCDANRLSPALTRYQCCPITRDSIVLVIWLLNFGIIKKWHTQNFPSITLEEEKQKLRLRIEKLSNQHRT